MREEISLVVNQVGIHLQNRGWQVAVAESCTGGWLGSVLTAQPGSSAYFYGGVISYSNQAKVDFLGVKPATLIKWGAVSEAVAREMAEGIRQKCGVELGIAITGIAGPTGGTAEKPVGLVWIGLASEAETLARCEHFPGDRQQIRCAAVRSALIMLQDYLEKDIR